MWDVELGSIIHKLPAHSSPVLDIKHLSDNSMDLVATLSEKQLYIFKLL